MIGHGRYLTNMTKTGVLIFTDTHFCNIYQLLRPEDGTERATRWSFIILDDFHVYNIYTGNNKHKTFLGVNYYCYNYSKYK